MLWLGPMLMDGIFPRTRGWLAHLYLGVGTYTSVSIGHASKMLQFVNWNLTANFFSKNIINATK